MAWVWRAWWWWEEQVWRLGRGLGRWWRTGGAADVVSLGFGLLAGAFIVWVLWVGVVAVEMGPR